MAKLLLNANGKVLMKDDKVYKAPEVENKLNSYFKRTFNEITLSDLDGVTDIYAEAFRNAKLDKMEIPNSITYIGDGAFSNGEIQKTYYYGTLEDWCEKVNITYNNSITRHGNPMPVSGEFYLKNSNDEFYELENEVIIPNTITSLKQLTFAGAKKIKSIIANNVTQVGNGVMMEIITLETIILPSLTSILAQCFYRCYRLKKLYIEQEDSICSLSNKNSFNVCYHFTGTSNYPYNPNGDKDGYIYVPASRLAEYKVATNWVTYESQIIGHQDFNVGDTLPNYTNETFTTQTWYSDEELTTPVTSVTTTGKYYCRLEA